MFTARLLDAFDGVKGVRECSFVENGLTKSPFFSTPVTLGPSGIEEVQSVWKRMDICYPRGGL